MKIFDFLAKSRLATYTKLQEVFTGQNDIAEHLQGNAECFMRDMLVYGDTNPLDSLHADNLGGPLHEMFVVAKTPDSFMSDNGECQKMNFRWTTNKIAEVTSTQVTTNDNLRRMLGGNARRKIEGSRMYARTSFYPKSEVHILDFYFDESSMEGQNARLNKDLYGEAGGYVIRGSYEYATEKFIVLLQGCHGGKKTSVFLCSEWDCPLQANFATFTTMAGAQDDFSTLPLIYPDNRDANCRYDNADPFCSPCKGKENCFELMDCSDGQTIDSTKTYANLGNLGNDFLISFEIKMPAGFTASKDNYFFTFTTDPGKQSSAGDFDIQKHNPLPRSIQFSNQYNDEFWMTVTMASHTIAGVRAWFAFYDYPDSPVMVEYDHTDANPNLPDGYNLKEDFFVVGGTVYDVTSVGATREVWPNEVRNAYVQKGSLQNIFPESAISRPHVSKGWKICPKFAQMGSTPVDYSTAKASCNEVGGHLAFFDNAGHLQTYNSIKSTQREWLGIERQNGNQWFTVTGVESTVYNWAGGEPNNAGGIENCAESYTSLAWNDIPCGEARLFSCRFDVVVAMDDNCPASVSCSLSTEPKLKLTAKTRNQGGGDPSDGTISFRIPKTGCDTWFPIDSSGPLLNAGSTDEFDWDTSALSNSCFENIDEIEIKEESNDGWMPEWITLDIVDFVNCQTTTYTYPGAWVDASTITLSRSSTEVASGL